MPRAGRELEQLVARIEGLLAGTGVVVTSPDYILGKNSRSRREVDISLRSKVGSADVLVIVECRDRDAVQGVDWIEQLAAKKEDVGASVAIAVSSDDFSEGARNTAGRWDIKLRRVDELSPQTIMPWFLPTHLELVLRRHNLNHVHFRLYCSPEIEPWLDANAGRVFATNGQPIQLVDKATGERVPTGAMWEAIVNAQPGIFDGLEPGDPHRLVKIVARYGDGAARYQLPTEVGPVDIEELVFEGEQWIETAEAPVAAMRQYEDESGEPISRSMDVALKPSDLGYRFSMHEFRQGDVLGVLVEVTVVKENGAGARQPTEG